MSFTIGSLFDGSGGFPLAAAMCGGTPVWASEIEPYPIAVTKTRFPKMKHLGSVTDIKGNEVEPVDVITFGSPCQDLSVAGKRAGLKHTDNGDEETTRSGLFMEAVRIIKEMREATNGKYPRFALWENVPGAFSSNKGEDFRIVLEELIKIAEPSAVMPAVPKNGWPYSDSYCGDGWSLAYRVFDAQYWGVPQRRRRIYLVLDLTDGAGAGKVSFERDGLRGYFAEGRTPRKETAGDAEGSAGTANCEGAVGLDAYNSCLTGDKAATLGVNCGISTGRNGVVCMATQQGGAEIMEDKCPTITASAGMSGNNQPVVCYSGGFCPETGGNDPRRSVAFQEELSPTVRAGATPAIVCKINDALPFDTTQCTHPANYSNPKLGDPCHPLAAGAHPPAVVCKLYDARGNGDGCIAPTITGDHNNRVTDYTSVLVEQRGFSMQGFGDYKESDVASGLKARDYKDATDIVVEAPVAVDRAYFNQGQNALYTPQCYEDGTTPTLVAKGPSAVAYGVACPPVRYIVRRLTPTECARLQGFADGWAVPDKKSEFTGEEYEFWLNVRNTHAEINGKAVKNYTKDQILAWYNKLHTDSAEYKLWGNGIALPCALYFMQGIAEVFNEQERLA